MRCVSHVILGLGTVVTLGHFAQALPSNVELVAFLVGSLAPDIDGDGTVTQPGFIIRPYLGWRIARLIDSIGALISGIIRFIFGHRKLFHWPIVGIGMMVCGASLGMPILTWFGFGYLTHIIFDSLTLQGIQIYAPFKTDFRGLRVIRTGSLGEFVLVILVLAGTIHWGWPMIPSHYQHGFSDIIAATKNMEFIRPLLEQLHIRI